MREAFAALREAHPGKDEVILPAYGAGSLVVAVRHAGLIPVLLDFEPHGWHPSIAAYRASVCERTLCAVAVHLFGIPQPDIDDLHPGIGVPLLEDACQAQGSSVRGVPCGSFGEISFFSFNKGKNIPAMTGGAAVINDAHCEAMLAARWDTYRASRALAGVDMARRAKLCALSLCTQPFWYAALQPLLKHGKDTRPPEGVAVGKLSSFAVAYVSDVSRRAAEFATVRARNAALAVHMLGDVDGIRMTADRAGVVAAYNRLPLSVDDAGRLSRLETALKRCGYESSRMYGVPLHRMFPDLGYARDMFPHATYQAEHLLAVPCHPRMSERDLCRMADVIGRTA
jgi:dTDP-4-amino-4,6-dideoxygalactose transaminase